MKKAPTKATTIRSVLIVMVILSLGLASAGFYFAFGWLQDYAKEVNAAVVESGTGGSTVESLQALQQSLNERKDVITATDNLFASSLDYQLQSVKDIKKYASDADIAISDYSFPDTPLVGGTATTTKLISAKLASPVSYTKLLKFMTALEGNIPKMQVASISLGRDSSGSSDLVITDTLTIEVYTK
jgi:hypothetical protein